MPQTYARNLLQTLALAGLTLLAACETTQVQPPTPDDTQVMRGKEPNYKRVQVHFGTNRAAGDGSTPAQAFGTTYSDTVSYGSAEVSIPRDHRMGELEGPNPWLLEFRQDPEKHVVLLSVKPMDRKRFLDEIASEIDEAGSRHALVFVHGYNTGFEDAARRTAQISYDIGFQGVPLFYSWPSQNSLLGYGEDERSVAKSQPLMRDFFRDLAERLDAETIYVLAHSMGTRATAGALAELFTEKPELRSRFRQIMLMAPDIDADVFRTQIAPALVQPDNRLTLYASSNDIALKASKAVHQAARLGAADPLVLMPGMDSIDASDVATDLLGHSYYADGDSVVADLVEVIADKGPAEQRTWLEPRRSEVGRFFRFKPVVHPAPAQ
ncbi:alpha/beta hydrolase [Niveibacterium microcysteis]|uniref:Alpha/beta hydrolase n=1 Tax=Niveibacterium microcysteis TaxID=2811415 RepID=A0ABX7M969_9RHOO|nr:alpha/beta hydrolase [Niveibacterium microcysteis]QSI78277.1 alpha/beta hydrolase [Niveibacterium microcysteis]